MNEGLVCDICGEYITYSEIESNVFNLNFNGVNMISFRCKRCNTILYKDKLKVYFLAKKNQKCTNCNNEIVLDSDDKAHCDKCGIKYRIAEVKDEF